MYDSQGRVKKVSSTNGWFRDNISYNKFGSITEERQYIPGTGYITLSYTYDRNNNLNSITYPDNKKVNISNNSLNMPETISFSGKSIISQVAYGINKQPTSMGISGNGTTFSAAYEANGLLSNTSLKKGSNIYYRANYGYDNVGNITSISNTVPSLNASFGYDALYRLTSASYSGGKSYIYTYDYYGNLTTAKENGSTIFNRTYTAKNQINSTSFDYDNRGNLIKAPGFEYEWDRQNQLSAVKLDSGETASTHMYNERGLRLKSSRIPAPSITIISPSAGETWHKNGTYSITWTKTGIMDDYVKILLYQGDIQVLEMTSSTENDGTYEWLIPLTLSPGQYWIAVQTMDGRVTGSSANFVIAEAVAVTVTSPNGGENWVEGSSRVITWTSTGTVGNVKIEYSIDNGTAWTEIIASTPNDGSYNWTIPETPSVNCLVRISETDGYPSDVSDAVFSIRSTITVTAPNGGEYWETGTDHDITWTSTASVGNVRIEYSTDNGSSWSYIVTSIMNTGSYSWRVYDHPSDQCLIRVSETDGDPSDVSDAVFSIVPHPGITVTSPNGGETWEVGSTYNITWTHIGIVGDVKIEYTTNNGTSWSTIAASTANDGSYSWTVPETPSQNCRVRVSETDGAPSDVSNNVFTIVLIPKITVTAPNGGENLEVGSTYNIAWISVGVVGNVKIDYSFNSGTSWATIIASTANDGSYSWTIPDTVSNNCLVRVSELDGDPLDVSDSVFSIVPPPSITVTSPNGGENWQVVTSHNITWTYEGIVGNVKIEYTTNNGSSWATIVTSTANDGTYNWTIPETPSSNCRVRVSETDGAPSDASDAVFSIVLPPSLTITSPNGGETWEKNATHAVTWTSTGIVDDVEIEYSIDNGTTWSTIIASTANDGSYDWTVPDTPSEGCLVRISETDGDPTDTSDAIFSIVDELDPGITVTAPNGGEIWEINSNRDITWTSTGDVGNVKIEYSTNTGTSWTTIVTSTANDGTYNWLVPANPSENCFIRVSETDGSPIDASDAVFSIISETSPCGKSWSMSDYPGTDILKSTAYGNSLFAAVGSGGVIWTSPDGITWTSQSSGTTNDLNGVIYGNNTFVAVGNSGVILTSPNGTNWTPQPSGTSNDLHGITYGGSTFTAVGAGGVILTSSDGITWAPRSSNVTHNLNGVGYGNNTFAAVGDSGVIVTSPNGTIWTTQTSNTSRDLRGITYGSGGGIFVAVGNSGVILTSPNGIDWNSRTSIVSTALLGAAYGSNKYVIVGQDGEILTSLDGIGWTAQSSGVSHHLYGVVYDNARFVAAGEEVIIYSLCGASSPSLTITSPNGGENVIAGTNLTITWASTGAVGDVKIDYSIDSGTSWTEITASYPNSGSFNWTVPDTPSTHCLVRVSETDGSPADVSDSEFTILPPSSATITVTSPNGGETLLADATHEITWTTTGTIDNVFIECSFNNGITWKTIVLSTPNSGSYLWSVPARPSDACLVWIGNSDAADGEPSDVSDAVFSIELSNSITVTSPNGGEVWEIGSTQTITWASTGTVGPVKIEYSIDRGSSWTGIIAPFANDGSYEWTIPDMPDTPLDECLVRINEHDVDEGPSDVSDEAFSIISSLSTFIRVTAPNGGERLAIGSTCTITWTSTAAVGDVKIDYSTDNGASWTEITAATENDGQYDWIVPDTLSDTCLVQVSEIDGDPTDVSDAVFSIVIPSTITVTSPNGGETWEAGTTQDITWTTTGTVGNIKIEYSIDNGTVWTEIVKSIANSGIYQWTVPDTPSDLCLVRISESDIDGGPSDVCDSVFSITPPSAPAIMVTYPNGGEALTVGSVYEITWTSVGTVGDLKIEYSTDNGTSWTEIIAATENDGNYEWTVPDNPSDNCMIRVSEADDGDPSDVSDAVFSIVPISSTLTVTSPNGGEILTAGSTHEITWTSTGTINNVVIEYSTDSGFSWTTIITSTTNDGSHDWTVPDTPSNISDNCLVKISMDDEDKNPFDVSDAVFSIVSSSSETIIVTSPNGGEGLLIGSLHEITWTSTGTINSVMIEYSTTNGSTWKNIIKSTENDGIYEWEVPDDPSTDCLVRISGMDGDENPSDESDALFSIVSETYSCGDKWLNTNYSGSDIFNSVTYGNSTFVAIGNNGVIKTSANGITWTTRSSGITNDLQGVIYGNNQFVTVGHEGTVLTSADGITWQTRSSGISTNIRAIDYGATQFAAVGDNGTIITSSDGITWTTRWSNTTAALHGVVYGGSQFAAVGVNGTILTSPDGINWTSRSSGTTNTLYSITYGENMFVAVGSNGVILTSSNGTGWTSRTSLISTALLGAAYGNATFVSVGENGKILTSSDAAMWTSRSSGVRNNLEGIVYSNLKFVTVGNQTIIYSLCQEQGAGGQNTKSLLMEKYGTDHMLGENESEAKAQKTLLQLISPDEDEILNAGENFLITWESEKDIENIKLEYSPDNGSTYLTIKDRIPNTGYYEWQVPHHISSNCLVRISNADGEKPEYNSLLYELKFKINSLTYSPLYIKDFSFWLGDKSNPNPSIPEISIVQEANGKEYIRFEENIKEIGPSRKFHNCWHRFKILADFSAERISIFLDEQPIFKNLPMSPHYQFNPEVSISTTSCDTTDVELDDLSVRVYNSIDSENHFITLFTEDFERFKDGRFPKNSGWVSKVIINQGKDFSKDTVDSISVQSDSINGNKSLKINNSEIHPFIVVKHFNIPESYPFDVSDRVFEIRYNEDMESQNSQESLISRHEVKSLNNNIPPSTSTLTSTLACDQKNSHGPNTGSSFVNTSSTAVFGTIQSTSPVDTYYIYSFDGKLMAEYDHDGNCVKDYIYAGNRLIAEYQPQAGKYYYYMSDQINSTRIITDDNGNVVYSEAYGPFGGVQKNWTKSYDPKLKFSGKEREAYGDLDYFGARYYDHNSYRFISTDPIINRVEALSNPQLWNLYAYCGNNPITFLDPDGREIVKIEVYHDRSEVKFYSDTGKVYTSPAALGKPSTPSPKPGTKGYAEGVFPNPTNPKWDNADQPWDPQNNPDNPFGPNIILVKENKGEWDSKNNNMHKHIHGTKGGWGTSGDTTNLGGSNPKKRRITHGCVRIPNEDIKKIAEEGVKRNAPVFFKK
jgi:RHS repeat-associated protein